MRAQYFLFKFYLSKKNVCAKIILFVVFPVHANEDSQVTE